MFPVSKAPPKITVHCPHCSGQQQEPALAKSTFCRKCSEYFAITPATLGEAPAGPLKAPSAPLANTWSRPSAPVPAADAGRAAVFSGRKAQPAPPPPKIDESAAGLRGKIEGILAGKPKVRVAHCFECSGWHEVSTTAHSSTCKACGAYIDLQDYKVTGSFSRNIKTRGSVFLSAKGDLSSSKIICSHATIHGKMRGNLTCAGKVAIRVQGKLFGSVEAGELIVERGSDVVFTRTVRAATAEIHGRMSGDVVADGHVTIFKSGLLDGAVSASGFSVERGGCFQGELTISPRRPAPVTDAVEKGTESVEQAGQGTGPILLAGGEQSPALG